MSSNKHGRAALAVAIDELKAGADQIAGNHRAPIVKNYLHGIVPEGNPWCSGSVSFGSSQFPSGIPFPYTDGARCAAGVQEPGLDSVVVARVVAVRQETIKGNQSPKVQGFSYVFSRMVILLGFGQVPD